MYILYSAKRPGAAGRKSFRSVEKARAADNFPIAALNLCLGGLIFSENGTSCR